MNHVHIHGGDPRIHYFAQMFLALLASAVLSGGSLLHAATPLGIRENLGVATPDTRFGVLESSG